MDVVGVCVYDVLVCGGWKWFSNRVVPFTVPIKIYISSLSFVRCLAVNTEWAWRCYSNSVILSSYDFTLNTKYIRAGRGITD